MSKEEFDDFSSFLPLARMVQALTDVNNRPGTHIDEEVKGKQTVGVCRIVGWMQIVANDGLKTVTIRFYDFYGTFVCVLCKEFCCFQFKAISLYFNAIGRFRGMRNK